MKKNKLSLKNLHVKSFITNLDDPHAQTIKGGVTDDTACGTGGGSGSGVVESVGCDTINPCKIGNSDGAFCAALSINPACPSEHTCQSGCHIEDLPTGFGGGGG